MCRNFIELEIFYNYFSIFFIFNLYIFINFGKYIFKEVIKLTSKELLYVEDALGHENFMKSCSQKASTQLTDSALSQYMCDLEKKHTEIFDMFLNLL